MKKKGFTLIELIITLNILVLLTTVTFTSIKAYNNRKINSKVNRYSYEIKSLLSYGKSYCRKYKSNGNFFIDTKDNVFVLQVVEKEKALKRVVYLEEDFSLLYNYKGNSIGINKDGYIKDACTISLTYKDKVVKEIKIGVGNDIIGVTEGDAIE